MAQQGKQMKYGAFEGFAYYSVKVVLLANGNRYDVDSNTFFSSDLRGLITQKISTCTFSVYYYETVAQTSHININQGILENILKNTEKNH
jgi:hypothetical protein